MRNGCGCTRVHRHLWPPNRFTATKLTLPLGLLAPEHRREAGPNCTLYKLRDDIVCKPAEVKVGLGQIWEVRMPKVTGAGVRAV